MSVPTHRNMTTTSHLDQMKVPSTKIKSDDFFFQLPFMVSIEKIYNSRKNTVWSRKFLSCAKLITSFATTKNHELLTNTFGIYLVEVLHLSLLSHTTILHSCITSLVRFFTQLCNLSITVFPISMIKIFKNSKHGSWRITVLTDTLVSYYQFIYTNFLLQEIWSNFTKREFPKITAQLIYLTMFVDPCDGLSQLVLISYLPKKKKKHYCWYLIVICHVACICSDSFLSLEIYWFMWKSKPWHRIRYL